MTRSIIPTVATLLHSSLVHRTHIRAILFAVQFLGIAFSGKNIVVP